MACAPPCSGARTANAGFSNAQPGSASICRQLDPVFGFEAVNVEAQSRHPSSLLNWMRPSWSRCARTNPAFGRGSLTFLTAGNRKILAYLREYTGDDLILCVANLARTAQPVELDLSAFRGACRWS